ncbi:MAG: hypothetical protein WDM80_06325 [Limisphaerales bacterium]
MNANFREGILCPFLKPVSKSFFLATLFALLLPYKGYCPPPNPSLQIQPTNGTASVSWAGSGYWLQAADQLGDPLWWYNSPWTASGGGPQFTTTVPMDSNMRFFRLVSSSFLPPPTGMRAMAGDGLMYVTWDTVSNAVSYNLYLATAPGVTPLNYNSLPNGEVLAGFSQTQAVFDNLIPDLRYYFVATAVNAQGESAGSNEGSDIFGPQGQVHGSFFTPVAGASASQIFVPGVTVTFQANGETLAQATTDGTGNFVAVTVPAGIYQVCWSAPGFVSGCSTQLVTVSNQVVYLEPQEIDPLSTPGTGLVFGDVKLLDGSVPEFDTNEFGTSLATTVTLKNSVGNLVAQTTLNDLGQFLFAGIPTGTNLTLTAIAEAASVSSNIDTSVTGEADLVLPNTPPVIESVVARLNGQVVGRAPTGATVQLTVTATDADNNFLHYHWLGGPGVYDLVGMDSSNLSLTLPNTNGLVIVYVQAGDGHGGYTKGQLSLNVEDEMTFNGYVQDTGGNIIVNAAVSVNSASTLSDTNGYFSFTLPFSQNQFLLNITAAGYAPFSKVLNDSTTGETYQLAPLYIQCTNWTGAPVIFSDPNGTAVALQVNSLESAPGVPYFGLICASIVTYDPCSNTPPYPAGNNAVDDMGNTNWITPQVTVYVSISDASGNPLMIVPGLPATLILPLGQTCMPLTNTSCVLPAWDWDPTNAVWHMTGLATNLAGDCASGPFASPMFQMGVKAVAAAQATCKVKISVDRTINLPVVMRVSSKPELIEINEKTQGELGGKGMEVPVNQAITFQLLSPKEAPYDYYSNPSDLTTLRKDKDKTVILSVTRTFTEDDDLELGLSAQIPLLKKNRVSSGLHFLTYNDPEKKYGANVPGGAVDDYYSAAGYPINSSSSIFLNWLRNNGFINGPNGTFENNFVEDASALYFNATDLGFARSMHMKTKPGIDGKMDIAYYVVNYTTMQDAVAHPTDDKKAVATVAMDYVAKILTNITSSATNYVTNRITRFYVFGFQDGGFSKNMGLRRFADLDGGGGKITPNLCVICHGSKPLKFLKIPREDGSVIDPPSGDVGGHFIPFDLESFTYKPGAGVQQDQFRALNRGLYLHTPLTSAMKELIEGWYGGALNNANNNKFAPNFVPAGWSANAGQKALYLNAVRVSCRGCHTMRENISFDDFDDLRIRSAKTNVICKALTMPNAQRTFTIFWGSMAANIIKNGATPDQPTLLKNQFNLGPCPAP